MAFPSPSSRRGVRPSRKQPAPPLEHDRSRLSRELEEIRQRELELKKEHEAMQRRVAELPREIEERERKQREKIRLRAIATPTYEDVFSRPRDKRHAATRSGTTTRRMTRPEQRSARTQFFLLCLILGVILILLWKSLP
jgi:chromosome segregation ATPase